MTKQTHSKVCQSNRGLDQSSHATLVENPTTMITSATRSDSLTVRLSQQEADALRSAATEAGQKLSAWMREALLRAATPATPAGEGQHAELFLSEVVGVRLLLERVFQTLLGGHGIPPEVSSILTRQIDSRKMQEARRILQQAESSR